MCVDLYKSQLANDEPKVRKKKQEKTQTKNYKFPKKKPSNGRPFVSFSVRTAHSRESQKKEWNKNRSNFSVTLKNNSEDLSSKMCRSFFLSLFRIRPRYRASRSLKNFVFRSLNCLPFLNKSAAAETA